METNKGEAHRKDAEGERKVIRRVRTQSNITPDVLINPRNRVIKEEVISVVNEALDGRHKLIVNYKKGTRAELEQEAIKKLELEKAQETVNRLRSQNEAKRKDIDIIQKRLEAQKLMPEVTKHVKKIERLRQTQMTIDAQIRDIEDEEKQYERFEKEMGLTYIGKVGEVEGIEGSDNFLITCTKIHQTFPDDPYHLYFCPFDFTSSGILFTPSGADPLFSEFNILKEEFTNSADLKGFIDKAVEYWKRDASAEGSPRLATPRNKHAKNR